MDDHYKKSVLSRENTLFKQPNQLINNLITKSKNFFIAIVFRNHRSKIHNV